MVWSWRISVAGLVSLISCCTGCRSFSTDLAPQRLNQGYTLILPGILGRQGWDHNLASAIDQSPYEGAIEIHDWTMGPLLAAVNMVPSQRRVTMIADKIVDYQNRYPGRPVYLIGHSGGTNMAVRALEALPPDRQIEKTILLAPGLASNYDLRVAMSHNRQGILAFNSPLDVPISLPLAAVCGVARGELRLSAATFGFVPPAGLSPDEKLWYHNKLEQHQYQFEMLADGHPGGHFGWTAPTFIAHHVAPHLAPKDKATHGPEVVLVSSEDEE